MLRGFLIGKDTAIARDSFIYNTASGLINAAQSVLILMVISRVLGDYDAGVFNIAWAVGNLFLNVWSHLKDAFHNAGIVNVVRHRKRFLLSSPSR